MDETYDVVVIGGGAAGLSGAVALARFRRSVLLVDASDPRNAPAAHVHNFLTRDGTAPADIYAAGRAELRRYGGHIDEGRVAAVHREDGRLTLDLGTRSVAARRVLVAAGARDTLPDIRGLAERWGIDVLHCPYCHGWEVRDRRIGILATGPLATHQALLFRQLSHDVIFLTHTGPAPTGEQREQLDALGIPVIDGTVVAVEVAGDRLVGVRLGDGSRVGLDALAVAPRVEARAEALRPLGLEPVEVRLGEHVIGTQIEADPMGATSVPGVWVAGNVANVQAQVVSAAAAGLTTAAALNADLVAEDTQRAVAAHREWNEQVWDERYRGSTHTWSGRANAVLVAEVTDLPPGTALDAGAGEGADACWLAAHGWKVTGADISSVALERAATAAEQAGVHAMWLHLDLARDPAPGRYDLVTSHFLHPPRERRQRLFRHLADAVAPGGTLLIVGHDPSDQHTAIPRPGLDDMGWSAAEVAESLGDGWTVEVAEARPRPATDPDGAQITIHDAVLRARRQM